MEFSKEIITILDYLCGQFGVAIDWTSENIMPYLQELVARYMKYEVFTSIAWMVTMLVVTLIIAIPLSILHKKCTATRWDVEEFTMAGVIFLWIAFISMSLASIFVIGVQVFDIIECCTLPEKVILEYLTSLMRTCT